MPTDRPAERSSGVETVRVASYNVLDPGFGTLAPWSERRENVAATISATAPGILALQEADYTPLARELDVPGYLASATGLELSDAAAGGSRFLYDRAVWRAGEHGTMLLPRSWGDHRRSAIWQHFSAEGAGLVVVGTHLSYGGSRNAARSRQGRALARGLRGLGDRIVVMGDFNSWHDRARTTPMSVLERAGFPDAHLVAPDLDTAHLGTWVEGGATARLDHIAVSRSLTVVATGIAHPELPGAASDHRLLWADLSFGARHSG